MSSVWKWDTIYETPRTHTRERPGGHHRDDIELIDELCMKMGRNLWDTTYHSLWATHTPERGRGTP